MFGHTPSLNAQELMACFSQLERFYCPLLEPEDYENYNISDILSSVFDYIETFSEDEFTSERLTVDKDSQVYFGQLSLMFSELHFYDEAFSSFKDFKHISELSLIIFSFTADRFVEKNPEGLDARFVQILTEIETDFSHLKSGALFRVFKLLIILRLWGSDIYVAILARFLLQQFASLVHGKEVEG